MHQVLQKLYRSPFARILSLAARGLARLQKPFMVYGLYDPATGAFRKYVRMSSTVTLIEGDHLNVEDHVWVGHHTVLDASGGLQIGEGCQIGSWVGVFTHGSHNAIRLLGRSYVDTPHAERNGYLRQPVRIGAYTFIGSGAMVLPGVTIGCGCLIGPNCVVSASVPDYAILMAPPARTVGSTLDSDAEAFREHDFSATYFNPAILSRVKASQTDASATNAGTNT